MAGRGLLPYDLTAEELGAVSAEVERLGGRVAAKVTKSVAYVVVPDRRAASRSDISAKAARVGAEILTLAQFKARAKGNWIPLGEAAA